MNVDVNSSGTIPVVQRDSNISLYDHQKEAYKKLSDWSRRQEEEPAGLLVLPTGGGKTLTATYWLMQNVLSRGKKILWIAHQYTLLEQAYHSFEMVCCRNISGGGKSSYSYRIVSGIHDSADNIRPNDDILIASKASLSVKKSAFRAWLEKNRDNFYFIIDEAHHAAAPGYRNLINDMRKHGGKFFMLGLTATPFRTAEAEKGLMKEVFPDDILYRTSITDLTTKGILSKAKFDRIRTDIDMRELFKGNDAEVIYNRIISNKKFDLDGNGKDATLAASLIAENQARNALIVKTYNRSKYGKTLVFALNRTMAELLYKYFIKAEVRANYVISGRTDGQDNNAIINDFKADKFDVLINVRIVTEGVDVPNVKTVFLTRPTKSKILMTQMIGRGLRGQKVGGTEETFIVDFLDEWRDELVAWVIPEKLYEEEGPIGPTLPPPTDSTGVKYEPTEEEPTEEELSDWAILHIISEETLAEFIRLANSKFDLSLFEHFSLIERIPLGYYYFEYDVIGDEGGNGTKTCNVMVYDCMKSKFDELIDWLNNHPDKKIFAVDSMVEAMADEIDEKFFGKREELLGYDKENIRDILRFYSQNEIDSPKFIEFAKRAEYDVSALAQHVADATYIEDEWNRPDGKWKEFFGEQNKMAFITAITAEVAKSAGLLKKPTNALTAEEIQTAEKMPLDVLVTRHPDIYEKIRDTVYESARENGEYVDSQSGRRSKSRLDFEISYKMPLNTGGKTEPANLRLVYMGASQYLPNTAWEDMPLSDIEHRDPARYKRICNAVYGYYQFRNGDYYDERNNQRSDNRFDFEIGYKVPLSAGGKTVPANLYLVYKKSTPPPPPPAVNFKTVGDLFDRFTRSINGQEKLAIKNEILTALSKLKETARQNRDAVAMNQVGIYYGRLHEHDEADFCYSLAKSFQVKPPPPIITPPAVDFKKVDDLRSRLAKSINGQEKLAIKNEILTALSKLKEQAQQNRDAVAMNQVGIYYGRLHEHDEADRCYSIEKEIRSKTPPPPPVVNFKTVDDLFDRFAKSTNGQEKLAIKNEILTALSKLKETAQQNRDAVAMSQVGIYYGRLHEPIPGTNLTWRLDDDGTLTISGTGNMKDWYTEENPAPWYGQRTTIKKVIIENGVTSIGEDAFAECESLTSVVIPNSVTSIGEAVFYRCTSLTEITIPNSVIKIGEYAFSNCESLKEIVIPDSVTSIGDWAFDNCASLTEITIPNSVIKIGRYAFSYCDLLKEIVIPDSVTSIGDWAFVGCESLTSVVIPNSVTSIGNGAFVWCESLTSVTLPDNFVFMKGAFVGCTSLKKINQPSLKDFFCDNLFVYHKRSDGLEINSFIGTTSKVVIPDSVTSIGDGAFYGCTSLTEITIPDSVTSIGYGAFYVCTSLTEITIPDSVYSIGGKSFGFCKSLTSITLPDNIKNLDNFNNFGKAVFVGCTSLKKIDQPSKVIFCDDSFVYEKAPEGIRINSFIGTTPTVTIPRSITSIGESAFESCESLTNITIPPNITKIWGNIFSGCSNLKTIRYTRIYRNKMETLKRKLSTGNDAELILY